MCSCSPRRLRSPVSGSCSARWRISSSWRADSTALIAWLANARSACSISSVGQQAVGRVVGPQGALEPALAVAQRDEQDVVVPGPPAAAVAAAEGSRVQARVDAPVGVVALDENHAAALQRGIEQRIQRGKRDAGQARELLLGHAPVRPHVEHLIVVEQ